MKRKLLLGIVLIFLIGLVSATFTEDSLSDSLIELQYSSQSWGDYDNDGNLDLAICGQTGSNDYTARTTIYKFINNFSVTSVSKQNFSIANITKCSINWADVDYDGWKDLIVAGSMPQRDVNGSLNLSNVTYENVLRVYKNNQN